MPREAAHRSWWCRLGLHRWVKRDGWTLLDGRVCEDCGKEGWDW